LNFGSLVIVGNVSERRRSWVERTESQPRLHSLARKQWPFPDGVMVSLISLFSELLLDVVASEKSLPWDKTRWPKSYDQKE
jgi:hypothetical protein